MAVESRIGPIELHFQAADHKIVMTMAESERILQRFYAAAMVDDEAILRRSYATTTQTVEGVTVPAWIALEITGGADPDMRMRVEIRDNVAVVTEVTWTSQPHQNPIRPKHLHQVNLDRMVTDLLASAMGVKQEVAQEFTQKIASGDDREILEAVISLKKAKAASRQLAERLQRPREYRDLTPEFLQAVAATYREHIGGKPTKAVAQAFNIGPGRPAPTSSVPVRRAICPRPPEEGSRR